jgi:hypothetical protein
VAAGSADPLPGRKPRSSFPQMVIANPLPPPPPTPGNDFSTLYAPLIRDGRMEVRSPPAFTCGARAGHRGCGVGRHGLPWTSLLSQRCRCGCAACPTPAPGLWGALWVQGTEKAASTHPAAHTHVQVCVRVPTARTNTLTHTPAPPSPAPPLHPRRSTTGTRPARTAWACAWASSTRTT